jgi:hypothetical protein
VPDGLIPLIKIATRSMVAACATQGTTGPQRVEEMTGYSAGAISRWQGDAHKDLIPIEVVFLVEHAIQKPVFSRALASLTSHRLVAVADEPVAGTCEIDGLTTDLIQIVGSGSRVGATLGSVLEDRKVTRREARDTLKVIGEHEERLAGAKRRLARLADDGKGA